MKKYKILFISILLATISSCIVNMGGIEGNGNIVKKTETIEKFTTIDARGAFKIIVIQGEKEAVEIETDENLMDYIIIKNESGNLIIDSREKIDATGDIIVKIYFKTLSSIELSGACELTNMGELNFDDINFDCDGASDCNLKLTAQNCKFELSGASEIYLEGATKKAFFDGSGAIEINAKNFKIENCRIDLSGASKAELFVRQTLELDLTGAATLRYHGGSSITKQNISGAASIKSF